MGAALFSVNPFGAFVVSFVARVLEGLCAALIFNALRKAMPKKGKALLRHWFHLHPGAEHCVLHGLPGTVLFYNCDYVQNLAQTLGATNAFMFIVLLVGVQAVIEWLICGVVASGHPCRCAVSETELEPIPRHPQNRGAFLRNSPTGPTKKCIWPLWWCQ